MPRIAREIAARIRAEVGEYSADTTGVISIETRRAVHVALAMFMTSSARGRPIDRPGAEVFRRLGRREAKAGRSHDALQSAYRIASRSVMEQLLVWERQHDASREEMSSLSAAVFSFIDELAQFSAQGYGEARLAQLDSAQARADLVGLLVHRDRFTHRAVVEAAERAEWPVPTTVTVAEIVGDVEVGSRLLGPGTLHAVIADRGLAVVSGRVDVAELRRHIVESGADIVIAVGSSVVLAEAPSSARLAGRLRARHDLREWAVDGVAVADSCIVELLLDSGRDISRVLATTRLAPLTALSPAKKLKYGRLLSAWLEHGTLAADEPGVLDKSRQTLRYQCIQLERMFGDALHERTARLELMLALRAALPLWERQAGTTPSRRLRPGTRVRTTGTNSPREVGPSREETATSCAGNSAGLSDDASAALASGSSPLPIRKEPG